MPSGVGLALACRQVNMFTWVLNAFTWRRVFELFQQQGARRLMHGTELIHPVHRRAKPASRRQQHRMVASLAQLLASFAVVPLVGVVGKDDLLVERHRARRAPRLDAPRVCGGVQGGYAARTVATEAQLLQQEAARSRSGFGSVLLLGTRIRDLAGDLRWCRAPHGTHAAADEHNIAPGLEAKSCAS
eukprot:4874665-Prymnesium_polylepis.1